MIPGCPALPTDNIVLEPYRNIQPGLVNGAATHVTTSTHGTKEKKLHQQRETVMLELQRISLFRLVRLQNENRYVCVFDGYRCSTICSNTQLTCTYYCHIHHVFSYYTSKHTFSNEYC